MQNPKTRTKSMLQHGLGPTQCIQNIIQAFELARTLLQPGCYKTFNRITHPLGEGTFARTVKYLGKCKLWTHSLIEVLPQLGFSSWLGRSVLAMNIQQNLRGISATDVVPWPIFLFLHLGSSVQWGTQQKWVCGSLIIISPIQHLSFPSSLRIGVDFLKKLLNENISIWYSSRHKILSPWQHE